MTALFNDRYQLEQPIAATTDFTIDFAIYSPDDVSVFIDGVNQAGAFTVTGTPENGIYTNATVTLATETSGADVWIVGTRAPRREDDFINGPDLVRLLNAGLDRAAATDQELYRDLNRSLRVPYGSASVATEVKPAASQYLAWNSDATALVSTTPPSVDAQPAFASRTSVTTSSIGSAVTYIRLAGYSTPGDLGDGLYRRAGSEPSHAGKIQSADGAWWELVPVGGIVHPEQLGAVRDGTTDDGSAIQNAVDYIAAVLGAQTLELLGGTYRADTTITVPAGVSISGGGMGQSIIDGSQTSFASLTNGKHIMTAAGSFTALPTLSTAVSAGDTTLTFTSAPSVSAGDLICIYNPTDSSFSGFRTYYRAGEYARVKSVSGSTVTVAGSLDEAYATADVEMYVFTGTNTARFADFTLKGLADTANAVTGIEINKGDRFVLENVRSYNASNQGIELANCVDCEVLGCHAEDDLSVDHGGDYGLILSNCQSINVIGGHFNAGRHAVDVGGAGGTGNVPSRYINFTNIHAKTSGGSVQAVNLHGWSKFVIFDGCQIDGGIGPHGDYVKVTNCFIRGKMVNGSHVYVTQNRSANFTFTGNTVEVADTSATLGNCMYVAFTGNTQAGGTLMIQDNRFIYTGTAHQDFMVHVLQAGYTGSAPINVIVDGNRFLAPNAAFPHPSVVAVDYAVKVELSSGNPFGDIAIEENKGVGGIELENDLAVGNTMANTLEFNSNAMREGYRIDLKDVAGVVTICGNQIRDMRYGTRYYGDSTAKTRHIKCANNESRLVGFGWASSSSERANLGVWYSEATYVRDNFATGAPKIVQTDGSITGTFTVGETITGGTSGATATVYDVTGDEFISVMETISGTFATGETITGGTSGATATLNGSTATRDARTYNMSFNTHDEIWHGDNPDAAGKGDYTNALTAVNAL